MTDPVPSTPAQPPQPAQPASPTVSAQPAEPSPTPQPMHLEHRPSGPVANTPVIDPPAPGASGSRGSSRTRRAPAALTGILALAAAVGMVIAMLVGVDLGDRQEALAATALAAVSILLSLVAIVLGLVAVVRRRGRRFGIPALILGVLGNPLVLAFGLAYLRGL